MEKLCPFVCEKMPFGLRRPARHISGGINLQVLSSTKARTSSTDNDNRKLFIRTQGKTNIKFILVVMNYGREGELKTLNQNYANN